MYSDDSMIERIQDDMLYRHLKSRYDEGECNGMAAQCPFEEEEPPPYN